MTAVPWKTANEAERSLAPSSLLAETAKVRVLLPLLPLVGLTEIHL